VGVFIRQNEIQIRIGAQIEFAHTEPAHGDDEHLIGRVITWRGMRLHGLPNGHFVGCRNGRIREIGRSLERIEDGRIQANALALDAKHFTAVKAAEVGCLAEQRGQISVSRHEVVLNMREILDHFRLAVYLVGKIRTVLE